MEMSGSSRHGRNASPGAKKPLTTKAAAQRLAQMMSQGGDDEDEDEEYLLVDSGSHSGLGIGGRSPARPLSRSNKSLRPAGTSSRPNIVVRPPSVIRTSTSTSNITDQTPSKPTPLIRTSPSTNNIIDQTPSKPPSPLIRTSPSTNNIIDSTPSSPLPLARTSPIIDHHRTPVDQSPRAQTMTSLRPSLSIRTNRQSSSQPSSPFGSSEQSLSSPARSSPLSMSSVHSVADTIQPVRSPMSSTEQSPSARATTVSRFGVMKSVRMVPFAVNFGFKQQGLGSPAADSRNKRLSSDLGSLKIREPKTPINQVSSTALQDKLDILQDENDILLEKLRLAEERIQECEAKSKHLEKQVADLGEGISMEARVLHRNESSSQQSETTLRTASETHDDKLDQIATVILKAEVSTPEQLRDSKSELKSLQLVVQRLILTQEEMEEVVLKRCWLARYWGLCTQYGIYPGIAEAKHEYWSSFAPLPLEIVMAIGQRAKDDNIIVNNDAEKKEKHFSELSGEGNAETMLMLDKGLKELAQLKVEDAVRIAMAQQRKKNSEQPASTEDLKSPGNKYVEDFKLTQAESEDVQFKQYWLIYFWRRAKNHRLEIDIADDRLQYWMNNTARAATAHDAVDVERGIIELRKLGLETQLWEESRRWLEQDSQRKQTDF